MSSATAELPRDQARAVRRIARRAIDSIAGLRATGVNAHDLQVMLATCHTKACPLALDRLLAADDLSFARDIQGIRAHLDPATQQLADGYRPAFRDRAPARRTAA